LELNTSRIYCLNSTTWSSLVVLGCGGCCHRTRFKFSGFSRRQRPDCFVESQRLHALGSQTSTHVCHCIDELHKTDHHIDIQILSVQPSCGRWHNDSFSFWLHHPYRRLDCWAQHSRHFRLEVIFLYLLIGCYGVAPLVERYCDRRVLVWIDYSAMRLTRQLGWWFVSSCLQDWMPKRAYCLLVVVAFF